MRIHIGIDTGGTYTDAIAYDSESKTILGSAKSLTTKNDLSLGIMGALDQLPEGLLEKAEIISLSTTLATNACVEDKGGNSKLIFFGGIARDVDEIGGKYGLPKSDEMYIQESFTDFSGMARREPDWEFFRENIKDELKYADSVGIIELYAMKNAGAIELKAKEIIREQFDMPVICSQQLYSKLNCMQRGASTLLNARLLSVIEEFLAAIKTALSSRNIDPSIVIVSSDGSLMNREFASDHPVETILCGPAASVIGGTRMTDDSDSIIIDMGGTTSDIALMKDGKPIPVSDGVRIGKWKTFVDGLYVRTFGLGGDSAIHYRDGKPFLEDYRVVPLCVAASSHPEMIDNLKNVAAGERLHTRYLHEHFILVKDIEDSSKYTAEEKRFCRALRNGPLILRAAAEAVGRDIYNLDVKRLLKEGIVQICGLTPTDIMHIKGDFSNYAVEASIAGAKHVAVNVWRTVDQLCDWVYDEVRRKIYLNIVIALLENSKKHYLKNGVDDEVIRLINNSYRQAASGRRDDFITPMFQTNMSLIGIGAPIHIFIHEVAAMLGTKAVVPEYHGVANALGAILGNISATCTVDIGTVSSRHHVKGFVVYHSEGNKTFATSKEAEEYAVELAKKMAVDEARRRGAQGDISVTCKLDRSMVEMMRSPVYLGANAIAHAVGSLGFNT